LALAALESFAAENTARLTTMESARLNIEEKLEELSVQERLQRQEEITAEVQEVTFGALASEPAAP
jgi:F-type H+-transporting ATPase subunit gamma